MRFENRFELVESSVAVSEEGRIVSGGREQTRGEAPAPTDPCRSARRDAAAEPGRRPSAGRRLACRGPDEASVTGRSVRFLAEPDEDAVLDAFVAAAESADATVLEIDMAHGYLLGSYLSPLTNDEDDRLRFPMRVLEAVRAAWAGPLAVRLSVTDWHPRGNTVDDGIAIARALARARLRPDPRRGRPDDPRRPSPVPARVPDRAQRPRPQRGARPNARPRTPDDARRSEHDRRRRPRGSRPPRPAGDPDRARSPT